ncbi:MAG: Fur family transcriptional regulator [Parashewanella sp.]
MINLDHILERAEQKCKSNDARLTIKRKQLLAGLLHSEKAISAYELADYCTKQFQQKFPIMTTYRILAFLEKVSFVHKLQTSNKYVACSHIACEHEHLVPQFLICQQCGKVKEIHINKATIDELSQNVKQVGFSLISPQLEIRCLCDECAE